MPIKNQDEFYVELARYLFENTSKDEDEVRLALNEFGASDEEAERALLTLGDSMNDIDIEDPETINKLPTPDVDDVQPGDEPMGDMGGDLGPMGGPGDMPASDIAAPIEGGGPLSPSAEIDVQPWMDMVDETLDMDPDVTPDEMREILIGQGASEEEADETLEQAGLLIGDEMGEEPTRAPIGARVMTASGPGVIESVYTDVWGERRATVVLDQETRVGRIFTGSLDDMQMVKEAKKELSEGEKLYDRVSKHLTTTWYNSRDKLPRADAEKLSKRAIDSENLHKEVRTFLAKPNLPQDLQEALDEAAIALRAEASYCKEASSKVLTTEEEGYRNQFNRYQVGAVNARGSDMGAGGGEVLARVAKETEEHLASIDWNDEVTTGADLFVEAHREPVFLGDSGEMRTVALQYIGHRTAHLENGEARKIAASFLANVEKSRRKALREEVKQMKTAAAPAEPKDATDEGIFL
jgi:hypothetical protein